MLVGPKKTLFMDEISTGLDSSTTFQIVKCMGDFVHLREGTVLMSLLQPAPEVYNLFDDVLLLSEGIISEVLTVIVYSKVASGFVLSSWLSISVHFIVLSSEKLHPLRELHPCHISPWCCTLHLEPTLCSFHAWAHICTTDVGMSRQLFSPTSSQCCLNSQCCLHAVALIFMAC